MPDLAALYSLCAFLGKCRERGMYRERGNGLTKKQRMDKGPDNGCGVGGSGLSDQKCGRLATH